MRRRIIDMWENQPLKLIILLAVLLRLIASIF